MMRAYICSEEIYALIDKIVYRLYDLTPEEIAVVESSAK